MRWAFVVFLPACVVGTPATRTGPAYPTTGPTSDSTGSQAAGSVGVPDVVGMTRDQAVAALAQAGVRGEIEYDQSPCGSVESGRVIELGHVCYQQPGAGSQQAGNLGVTLRVQTEDPRKGNIGRPTEWRLMPDLHGSDAKAAVAKLQSLGFDADRVEVQVSDDPACAPAVVCRTNPEPQQRAGIHSTAIIYVGK